MGKKLDPNPRKVSDIPPKEPFVPHTRELLMSPAWRGMSINCRRLIEFLEIEHMNHAGLENGNLIATYDQLVEWGIGRRFVHKAITEAEQRGLVTVERGGRKGFAETHLSRFRLTYLKARQVNEWRHTYYTEPTNEWRRYRKPLKRPHRQKVKHYDGELLQCTKVNSDSAPSYTQDTPEPAETHALPTVHEGEPLIISRGTVGRPGAGEPRQIDLEDLTGRAAHTPPMDKLRAATRRWVKQQGRGATKRLAEQVGVKPCTVSNFLAGRWGINSGAAAALRDVVAGMDMDRL